MGMLSKAGIMLLLTLSQPDVAFDEFFTEFVKQRNSLELIEARFVQTTRTPDETMVSKGTLVYSNPRRLLFRYDDPEVVFIIAGLRGYEYDAELAQLQIFELEDSAETEALYMGFDDSAERLQKAYDIRLVEAKEGAEMAVELRPRSEFGKTPLFERVELQLREGDLLPISILIRDDAESDVSYEIKDIRVNEDAQGTMREFVVPEGTRVIENEDFVLTVGEDGLRVPLPEGTELSAR